MQRNSYNNQIGLIGNGALDQRAKWYRAAGAV